LERWVLRKGKHWVIIEHMFDTGQLPPAPARRPRVVGVPPGWPSHLRPPGVAGWESDAVAFLLDCCPPDFRRYPLLRRHPVVLGHFAEQFVTAQAAAADAGTAGVRTHLNDLVDEDVIEAAIETWLTESARLARARRAVGLVAEALRAGGQGRGP
jgi:hypothetical protein